jgi:hypothetical protein
MMGAIWRRMSHAADPVHVMKGISCLTCFIRILLVDVWTLTMKTALNLLHWLLTLKPPSAAVQVAMVNDCSARREQFKALAQVLISPLFQFFSLSVSENIYDDSLAAIDPHSRGWYFICTTCSDSSTCY